MRVAWSCVVATALAAGCAHRGPADLAGKVDPPRVRLSRSLPMTFVFERGGHRAARRLGMFPPGELARLVDSLLARPR